MNLKLKTSLMGTALAGVLAFGVACSDDSAIDDLGPLQTPSAPDATLPALPPASSAKDRDEFITNVNNQIDRMEQRIAEIETEAKSFTGDAREEADRQVDELKSVVTDLHGDLDRLEMVDETEAEEMQDDIEAVLNDIRAKIDELAGQLGI